MRVIVESTESPHTCISCGETGGKMLAVIDGEHVEYWHVDCHVTGLSDPAYLDRAQPV
jgi:hypothetical protein